MNIAIFMSSSFRDKTLLFDILDKLKIGSLVCTGESGTQYLEEYAKARGKILVINHADYKDDDGSAALKNRADTIISSDRIVVFWDGSKGIKLVLEIAKREKKLAKIVKYENPVKDFYFFSPGQHPLSLDFISPIKINDKSFYNAKHALVYYCAAQTDLRPTILDLDFPKKTAVAKLNGYFKRYMVTGNPDLKKILYLVNREKFKESGLLKFLLATKGKIAYCADEPFGINVLKTAPEIYEPESFGANLLGKILDKLRNDLFVPY